jgi:hypothetical protein
MNPRRLIRFACFWSFLAGVAALAGGCNIIGAAAQIMPQPDIAPAYKGLGGQTVGVMVWVDRGVRIDYPNLQADIARDLTGKLTLLTTPRDPKQQEKVAPEMAHVRYLDPMAVVRFQADHPQLEGMPSEDLAKRLGVTRVIYLQVYSFETRPQESIDLFKGTLLSRMEVLEVSPGAGGAKTVRVGYSDPDLHSVYPPHRPEGVAGNDVNSEYIYRKTVDQFTTDVALKFVQHPQGV